MVLKLQKKLNVLLLSILATDDKMCPVKEGKKLAALIEGSQVDIIDNCGHMMLLEEADRVLTVLKKIYNYKLSPIIKLNLSLIVFFH